MTQLKRLEYKIYSDVKPHLTHKWCVDQLGPRWDVFDNREGRWAVFWVGPPRKRVSTNHKAYEYLFAREQDAVMFALRWS
jgi:hypothetical protein